MFSVDPAKCIYAYAAYIKRKKSHLLVQVTNKKSSELPSQGLFQQFWEKAPGQNWGKKIDLTSKLGEINNIEHYKGSKIYNQNKVILDRIMPGIPLTR